MSRRLTRPWVRPASGPPETVPAEADDERGTDMQRTSGQIKVEAQDVQVTFRRRGQEIEAVRGLSLAVREGEFLSIVGPSGCGKSTFLRLVAGLESPTSGQVRCDGKPIRGASADRGMAFQQYALFPWMTLAANVDFGPRMRRLPKAQRRERVERYIRLVGLTGFEDKYPHELSGGMQQRGSLARLFANDPSLLLMDEPLGALDAQTRVLLQEELMRVWEEFGTTVIFITHSIDEATFLSDRVAVMTRRPGRIKEIIPVNLPRPRTFETRGTEAFAKLEFEIGRSVREEVDALS